MSVKDFGDETKISIPDKICDCSDMNFFDELEYDCWSLIEKYASAFGCKIIYKDGDKSNISFNLAKDVQCAILNMFRSVGALRIKQNNNDKEL